MPRKLDFSKSLFRCGAPRGGSSSRQGGVALLHQVKHTKSLREKKPTKSRFIVLRFFKPTLKMDNEIDKTAGDQPEERLVSHFLYLENFSKILAIFSTKI